MDRGRRAFTRYGLAATLVNALLGLAPARGDDPVRILVLGDSLTAGLGLPRADAFPARLEAALVAEGLAVEVVNAGLSGDTSAGGRARLAWTLAPVGGRGVDAVVVELGANDGLRGIDPETTHANLDAILGELDRRGLPVLLTGMRAPPNMGRDYAATFAAVFPRLAERHGVLFYPFFLEGVAARPEFNQDDGIHPNSEGVGVIVAAILPKVRELARMARTRRGG